MSNNILLPLSSGLTDIGDAPYDLVSPVLVECTAIQLGQIELNSPVRRVLIVVWDDLKRSLKLTADLSLTPARQPSTSGVTREVRGPPLEYSPLPSPLLTARQLRQRQASGRRTRSTNSSRSARCTRPANSPSRPTGARSTWSVVIHSKWLLASVLRPNKADGQRLVHADGP